MKSLFLSSLFLIFSLDLVFSDSSPNLYSPEISALQSELKLYTKARSLLQSSEPLDFLTILPDTDATWSLSKFLPKCVITSQSQIATSAFITLKPMPGLLHTSNIGILIGYTSGIVELREITGKLLYNLDLGYSPVKIIATNSYEDIRFLCITPKSSIEIFSIVIEKPVRPIELERLGIRTNKVFISITKEIETTTEEQGTAAIFHIKGGKKFWVVGGKAGSITYFSFTGKKELTSNLGIGEIKAFDRFGPQLVASSDSNVGIVHSNNQEIQYKCELGGNLITFDAVNVTSVVYAVNSNEIVIFDTRNVQNEQFYCKTLKRLKIKTDKILSTKEYLITWDNGVIRFFKGNEFEEVNRIKVSTTKGASELSFTRVANGGFFIGFCKGNQMFLYEYIEPIKPGSGFDFSNMRIGLIVAGIMYWQFIRGKKSPVTKEKKNN